MCAFFVSIFTYVEYNIVTFRQFLGDVYVNIFIRWGWQIQNRVQINGVIFLRRPYLIRKIFGILLALTGSVIIVEMIPLWLWYGILSFLIICFAIIFFKII